MHYPALDSAGGHAYSGGGKHLDKVFHGLDESELCRCKQLASNTIATAVRAIQEGNANAA